VSVEIVVFLAADRMITPQQWQSAIQQNSFDLELDTDFDVQNFTGFLPCQYKGAECGFEYSRLTTDEAEPPADARIQIGAREIAVSFITHPSLPDLMASVIASGVLCAQTEGILFDTEAEEAESFIAGSAAIEWARFSETAISQHL
jgi:hypothetical protein